MQEHLDRYVGPIRIVSVSSAVGALERHICWVDSGIIRWVVVAIDGSYCRSRNMAKVTESPPNGHKIPLSLYEDGMGLVCSTGRSAMPSIFVSVAVNSRIRRRSKKTKYRAAKAMASLMIQ